MSNDTTTEPNRSVDKPVRRARGRGGLGRGLGALIPPASADRAGAEEDNPGPRPLDVLFPNLSSEPTMAAEVRPARQRGGSARDLLAPRAKRSDVSRETKTGDARSKAMTNANLDGSGSKGTSRRTKARTDLPKVEASSTEQRANVSRETTARKVDDGPAKPVSEPQAVEQRPEQAFQDRLQQVPGATFGLVRTDWIIPNLKQPRQVFESDELKELAASVAEVGVLQPIVLRPITEKTLDEEGQAERLKEFLTDQPEARYELVMGERRLRASQLAGLETIPAIIRTTEQTDLLRDALLENLHRVQLNPLEEAAAYSQLLEEFSCTQEELSRRIARSRPQIANTLRLLRLPPTVQRQLAAGVISAGHARALLALPDSDAMQALAKRIVAEGLSVRATEEQVKFGRVSTSKQKRERALPSPEARRVAESLSESLETTVSVSTGAKRGRLIIDFADQQDLYRIAAQLGVEDV